MHADDFKRLLAQIKRHEGARRNADGNLVAYRCAAGALTVGYGHNLDANPVPELDPGSPLSEPQAEQLLIRDVTRTRRAIASVLPWAENLTAPRYAVLVNMAFNLGLAGLLEFKSTLAFVRVGDFRNAAKNMLKSKWASQVGTRATELAEQMETGTWRHAGPVFSGR